MSKSCAGVSLRGYRVGEPCGAIPKYQARGRDYCAAHYVVALKEPRRFREALEAYVRGEARRERSRRAMDAAERQIDAFPLDDAALQPAEDSCSN